MGGRGANSFQRGNYKQMLNIRKLDGADYEVYQGGAVKGIEQISIYGGGEYSRDDVRRVLEGDYKTRRDKDTITQDELNNSPVVLMAMQSRDLYIFNSKADMDKVMKHVYGGYSQIGKMHKDYMIYSGAGKGNFYLQRNKLAKGGFEWVDDGGNRVSGFEYKKRQSDAAYTKRIRRKVYGEE